MLAAALAALLVALLATPAHAAGYRYWSFWEHRDGSWSYANQGPSVLRPVDGDVLGFRFSVSENSGDASKPRGSAAFDAICEEVEAKPGTKRIALLLDFGTAADAPDGERPPEPRTECARVAEDATAADALAATAKPLRYNSSALLCAIAGYPRQGCGEQVSTDGPDRTAKPEAADGTAAGDGDAAGDGRTAVGVATGIGLVVLLAAGAVWQSRRRRG